MDKSIQAPNTARDVDLNRWTLNFRDSELEERFRVYMISHSLPAVRNQILIATISVVLFGVVDFFLLAAQAQEMLVARAVICALLLAGVFATYLPNAARYLQVITTGCVLIVGGAILWMIATLPPPYSYYYYAGLILVIIFACNIQGFHYFFAAILMLCLTAAYVLVALFAAATPIQILINNIFFLLCTLAWTVWTTYRQERYQRQEFASKYNLHLEKQRSDELLDAARAGNKAKSEFLAVISHELRTPLNAIIGFSEIMRKQLFGPLGSDKYVSYADDIAQSGNHLLEVINDILDISKAEAGKLDLAEDEIDIAALISQVLRMCRDKAVQGGLTLVHDQTQPYPVLWGDPRLIKQSLINLLSNAIKFTPPGGRVTLAAERCADGGFQLSVSDTGIGIAPEHLRQVLEPFVQVESAMSRKHGGTGLGLPLVRRIAELHGGAFRLESEPGQGTSAIFILPPSRVVSRPGSIEQTLKLEAPAASSA